MVNTRGSDDSMLLKDMIPAKKRTIKIKVPPKPAKVVGGSSSVPVPPNQANIIEESSARPASPNPAAVMEGSPLMPTSPNQENVIGESSSMPAPLSPAKDVGGSSSKELSLVPMNKRAQPDEEGGSSPIAKKKKTELLAKRGDGLRRLKIRTSPRSLVNFIEGMRDDQKIAVEEMGFGSILLLEVKELPQALGFWLVSNIHTGSRCIKLGQDRHLHISSESVKETLGIPLGGREICATRTDYCPLVARWLKQFKKASVFHVTVGDLVEIMKEQRGDQAMFKWNFLVLFSTLMVEGTSGRYVNHCVLYAMRDVNAIPEYDWCGYVIDGLIESQKKWEKSVTGDKFYTGPMTFIMLYYVDRVVLEKRFVDRAQPSLIGWTSDDLKDREFLEKQYGSFGEGYIEKDPYVPKKVDNVIPGPGQEEYIVNLAQQAIDICDRFVVFKETTRTAISKFSDSITVRRLHDAVNEMVGARAEHDIEEDSQDGFWSHPEVVKAIEAAFRAAEKVNSQGHRKGNNCEDNGAAREDTEAEFVMQGRVNVSEDHEECAVELGKDSDVGVEEGRGTEVDVGLEQGDDAGAGKGKGDDAVVEEGRGNDGDVGVGKDKGDDVGVEQGRGMPTFSLGIDDIVDIGRQACEDASIADKGELKEQKRTSGSSRKRPTAKKNKGAVPASRKTDLVAPLTTEEILWMEWLLKDQRGGDWEILFEVLDGGINVMRKDLTSMRVGAELAVSVISAWAVYMNFMEEKRTPDEPSRFFFTTFASLVIMDMKNENWAGNLQIELGLYPDVDITKVDLVFFPVHAHHHYYLVCVDMKKHTFAVIDNLQGSSFRAKYGNQINNLRKRFSTFIEKLDPTLSVKIYGGRARAVKIGWSSSENKIDCGIYCMFHMERYMGEDGKNWGFPMSKDNADQIAKLRHRYVMQLITYPSNTTKIVNESRFRSYCAAKGNEEDQLSPASSERTV